VVVVRRRRRTRRHRRNRSLRKAVFCAGLAGILLGFWVSMIPEGLGTYLSSFLLPDRAPVIRNTKTAKLAPPVLETPGSPRDVYPYSLVPGGVRDAKELRDVFDHDPVLAAHYRNFDFRHARIVRLTEDRTVYVSYRIGGKIYWTTKLVSLHAGEMLITDGVIAIRTRCGNQVSVSPRHEVSPSQEPNVALLERPMRFFDPQNPVPPAPTLFESSFHRPDFPVVVGPSPNFRLAYAPTFGLIYPPSLGVCAPGRPQRKPVYGGPTPGGTGSNNKHKHKGGPCDSGGGTPGEAPEPTSLLLLSTGLGGILLRYRMAASKQLAKA
jgi:hypothetical protein